MFVFAFVTCIMVVLGAEEWLYYRHWQRENRECAVGLAAIEAAQREGRVINS